MVRSNCGKYNLKPCPFCGSNKIEVETATNFSSMATVVCLSCEAEITKCTYYKEDKRLTYNNLTQSLEVQARALTRNTVKAWNRRVK